MTRKDSCYVCDTPIADRFLILKKRRSDSPVITLCQACYEKHRHIWEKSYTIVSYRLKFPRKAKLRTHAKREIEATDGVLQATKEVLQGEQRLL